MKKCCLLFVIFYIVIAAVACAAEESIPDRYSLALTAGKTYKPLSGSDFTLISMAALFDYDRIWPHRAPEPLRFKVEGSLGVGTESDCRAVAALDMLALYFLDGLHSARLRPYVEAGIGLMYTDFQIEGQGLRLNFNPQAGIGAELQIGQGAPWFGAIRLHHVSNGNLHADNRGLNAVLLQVGRFF